MQGVIGGRRIFALSVAVGLIGLAGASSATAATQVGLTFAPTTTCSGSNMTIQRVSVGNQYVIPSAGVITSWSVQSGSTPVIQAKLKLARPAGGNNFTIVAESAAEVPRPGTSTFATRIPVSGGELLGRFSVFSGGDCDYENGFAAQNVLGDTPGDPPVNSTNSYTINSGFLVDVSATLEPDADGDGFGDETQDQCPTSAATQNECVPPETQITKHPKDKTKKNQAKFEFTSSEPGSTFLCSFDGDPLTPCTSPEVEKVKKGKHEFDVVAVDAAGNRDATPAEDSWKVKKKKKK